MSCTSCKVRQLIGGKKPRMDLAGERSSWCLSSHSTVTSAATAAIPHRTNGLVKRELMACGDQLTPYAGRLSPRWPGLLRLREGCSGARELPTRGANAPDVT